MNLTELAPGFAYWMAPHPEWEPDENWPEDVLCVYFEASDGTVVIDPLVPRGRGDEFWRFLDGAVERRGLPVRVLLTAPWHARDAAVVADSLRREHLGSAGCAVEGACVDDDRRASCRSRGAASRG